MARKPIINGRAIRPGGLLLYSGIHFHAATDGSNPLSAIGYGPNHKICSRNNNWIWIYGMFYNHRFAHSLLGVETTTTYICYIFIYYTYYISCQETCIPFSDQYDGITEVKLSFIMCITKWILFHGKLIYRCTSTIFS